MKTLEATLPRLREPAAAPPARWLARSVVALVAAAAAALARPARRVGRAGAVGAPAHAACAAAGESGAGGGGVERAAHRPRQYFPRRALFQCAFSGGLGFGRRGATTRNDGDQLSSYGR